MSDHTIAADGERLHRALIAIRALRERVAELEGSRHEPIAIVGMACRFPGGATDPDRYWELLERGGDGVVEIPQSRMALDRLYDPHADPERSTTLYTRRAGLLAEVDRFDAAFFRISPREAASLDPQHRLALEVAWSALERAAIAPASLAGTRAGVILGMTLTDYDHLIRAAGPHNIDTYHLSGNCLNFAAGRIAYLLGLHGPTLVLDSACSSSLVAIHLACQALRTREADLMLAGGVNVILSPDGTLMVCKMRMVAPDGRCKTFDAGADGFVRGEGCGIVVLKRLRDALAAHDPVVAVIRATAVNQDGASSGLTVPNGRAQQALIEEALARAGLVPDDVGYVECHGTGTALGDPIEVEALGAALARTRRRHPLAIGSVKTNFGHLESAAGVAGLMKAALVVERGAIPPHLHLSEVSPHLSLRDGDLMIPTRLTPWPAESSPRIAGVSSFGASGTNAHAILEEPPRTPAPSSRDAGCELELLALSAATPAALRELCGRYAAALAGGARLADVCHTAGVGRDHFPHRLALVGSETPELVLQLEALARGEAVPDCERGEVAEKRRDAVFLFPGQGAQYPGMGLELYEREPAFRAALDECRSVLDSELERPLLELLQPGDGAGERLRETRVTQPALFAVEYALAQLWRSLGIEPAALVGHSVGEYVAACIAGILPLADACRLIAARGRLMQELSPPGAMAALYADEARVARALEGLDREVGVAAVNGPASVVIAGSEAGVARAVERLAAAGVRSKRLAVSRAFHSPLMEPVLEPFRRLAEKVPFGAPRLPLLSNLTGGELDAATAASPDYWCRHLREPVRFADSMRWLLERDANPFLEVGPGSTLIGLAQQSIPAAGRSWIATMREGRPQRRQLLQAVGALYAGGVAPAWAELHRGRDVRRIVLPTYPFERRRHWKTIAPAVSAAPASQLLHEVEWRPTPRAEGARGSGAAGSWLLLADRTGFAERLADRLRERGGNAVLARPGDELARLVSTARGIVHCLALDARPFEATTLRTLAEDRDHALLSLLPLLHSLPEPRAGAPSGPTVTLVTRGAAPVEVQRPGVSVAGAMLWGAGRALALERADAWGALLDLDPAGDRDETSRVAEELLRPDGEDQLAWRGGQRYAPRLAPSAGIAVAPLRIASDRTYLVTGALGEAGRRVTRLLVRRGARRLLLVGRRGATTPEAHALLAELRAAGVEAEVVHADVADPAQMRRVEAALADAPPLAGVVHAAGGASFDRIADLRPTAFRAALDARVLGGWALHELTHERPLDFFVCLSSVASVWGAVGQLHDTAGHRFLDVLAHARRARGLPAAAIGSSPWKGGGAANLGLVELMHGLGIEPIEAEEGEAALEAAIESGRAHLVIAKADWSRFRSVMEARRERPLLADLAAAAGAASAHPRPAADDLRARLAAAGGEERRELLIDRLQDELADLLGSHAEPPDPRRGFVELGLDSLMAVTLRNRLEASLGVELPVTFVFDHPTIEALAEHLLGNVLVAKLGAVPAPATATSAVSGSAIDEVRGLSQQEVEHAIAEQLRDLGLD